MNEYLTVLNKFLAIKEEEEITNLFPLLPEKIKKELDFYEFEKFKDYEKHYFYIFTSLLIKWAYFLLDTASEKDCYFLDNVNDVFEFIGEKINKEEQKSIIQQVKNLLAEYTE